MYPDILVEMPGVDLEEFINMPTNAVKEPSQEEDLARQVTEAAEEMNINNFFFEIDTAKDIVDIMSNHEDNSKNEDSVNKGDDVKEMEPPTRENPPIYDVD